MESETYLESRTCKKCGRFDILCECQTSPTRPISERERIAKIILVHGYSPDLMGMHCFCSPTVRRTAEEHALHVADRIQNRRER